MLLPEIPKVTAMIVAEKIRKNVEELETIYEDKVVKITVSIGLDYFSNDTNELNHMINKVDQILYRAKDTGRNKVSTEI